MGEHASAGQNVHRDREIVLVHSSDLHVDDPIGPGPYNGLIGLAAVLARAAELAADIVLLAGDTFDNPRVSSRVLQQAAETLGAAERPVVMLPGNHDPGLSDCLFRRAGILDLPNVHVLGIDRAEAITFDHLDLEIWGRAHRDYANMAPLREPRPRRTRWLVALAHGHYVPPHEWTAQAHRAWLIHDDDLARTEADYVALGHWDRPAPVGDGRVPAYYSGSPDLAGTVNVVRLCRTHGVAVTRAALNWD